MSLLLVKRRDLLAELGDCPTGAYLATDADGTLWSGDVGEDFCEAMLDHGDFRESAALELRGLASRYGIAPGAAPHDLARSLFQAYTEGIFPEDRCCAMIAALSTGWSERELSDFCAALARRKSLPGRIHRELFDFLAEAHARSIAIVVVSASPIAIVRAGISAIDLPVERVLAVDPIMKDGVQTARVKEPMPYDRGKADALVAALGDRVCVAAFGDNAFDVPMLQHTKVPIAVRPKARLLARANEVPTLRVLAREDA